MTGRRGKGINAGPARGFSMIEMMIVLVIIAAVVTLSAPGFEQVRLSVRLRAAANDMVSSVYQARSEAIKRNGVVQVCKSANVLTGSPPTCTTGGGWEQGWIVFDTDGALDPNAAVISTHPPLAAGFLLRANRAADELVFNANGFLAGGIVELTACRLAPTQGNHEKVVTVSGSGATTVARTESGSCP